MSRLCERPGCSAPAAVAYGMESDRLVVWLEAVPEDARPQRVGMLCRRHADAMVVPRGWTLDDRREAVPRLFRVAEPVTTNHPSRGRTARKVSADETSAVAPLQLDFDDAAAQPDHAEPADDPTIELTVAELTDETRDGDGDGNGNRDADETQAMPWRPVFDHDDDLDGLLNARSPLLSRAFRGQDPPRPTGRA